MRKKVAVVILSWNGKKFLEKFLPSVIQHTSFQLCDVVIADNCSSDDSVEFVSQSFPAIKIIQNSRNGGYAGGYNDALKQIDAEYLVLLNQDVEVTAQWVENVIDEMEKDTSIAAAQPKLRDFYRREYFEYAGGAGGFLDRNSYAFCRGRIFNAIEKDEGQYDNVTEIFWATGACLFVRSDVFKKAGDLDEDFFAHQEEIDLCWRIRNMGYKVVCVPASIIYHVGGGSLPQGNPRKTYLNFRNNIMMMFKNLPASNLFLKIVLRINLDLIAAFYSIYKNKNSGDFFAILRALKDFLVAIPALQKKRKAIPHPSSVHLSNINILWQHFAKGISKFKDLPL